MRPRPRCRRRALRCVVVGAASLHLTFGAGCCISMQCALHPYTSQCVLHPCTSQWVLHPCTSEWVLHPCTSQWVLHPCTSQWVLHPNTSQWALHPNISQWVLHPCTSQWVLDPCISHWALNFHTTYALYPCNGRTLYPNPIHRACGVTHGTRPFTSLGHA